MATTQHTCGGPVFGRKTPGCPRCDELIAGAQPVRWTWTSRRDEDEQRCREIAAHRQECTCGPVCTFGQW